MVAIIIRPVLQNGGFHNTHFADAVVMFLVIPFSHLINDEEISFEQVPNAPRLQPPTQAAGATDKLYVDR